MTRFHLILTILLGLGAQARAETVTWIIHDAPPQYIFDGPLAGSHRLTGAYLAGRVHARAIEDFIALPGRAVPLQQIVSPRQLYALVQTGRVDFTFGGPHEIRYAQRTLDGDAAFEALPIRGVPRLVKTYLSCSKKPIGKAVIAAVDETLSDPARWADFLAPLEAWMDGSNFAQALAAKPEP